MNQPISETHPNLFADAPLFLSRRHVEDIEKLIAAIQRVSQTQAWRDAVKTWAPILDEPDVPQQGVFFGYDFHFNEAGPQLIEVNTNAGGALFNAYLARAQKACCPPVAQAFTQGVGPNNIEKTYLEMFRKEFHLHHSDKALKTIAIIDKKPEEQGMYPEFLLFKHFFESQGIKAFILDPSQLHLKGATLFFEETPIDLIYNRLCDFYLEEPEHSHLRQAYDIHETVITPHPHAYARFADKRNLTLLSNRNWLEASGISQEDVETLIAGVPETIEVTQDQEEVLWKNRKAYFFKPTTGFGSKAVYRGAKLTKKVFQHILQGGYVAQKSIPPAPRNIERETKKEFKSDIRAYTYAGQLQYLAARLYRGQTTNMRTEGGGFAAVFCESGTSTDI